MGANDASVRRAAPLTACAKARAPGLQPATTSSDPSKKTIPNLAKTGATLLRSHEIGCAWRAQSVSASTQPLPPPARAISRFSRPLPRTPRPLPALSRAPPKPSRPLPDCSHPLPDCSHPPPPLLEPTPGLPRRPAFALRLPIVAGCDDRARRVHPRPLCQPSAPSRATSPAPAMRVRCHHFPAQPPPMRRPHPRLRCSSTRSACRSGARRHAGVRQMTGNGCVRESVTCCWWLVASSVACSR